MDMTVGTRETALRRVLEARRQDTQQDVRARIRVERNRLSAGLGDATEEIDRGSQSDVALAAIQIQSDILKRLDEAIARLDAGRYGQCGDCNGPIAESRLRALPFAIRCRSCAEQLEEDVSRRRPQAADDVSPFAVLG